MIDVCHLIMWTTYTFLDFHYSSLIVPTANFIKNLLMFFFSFHFSIVMCNLWNNLHLGWRHSVFERNRRRNKCISPFYGRSFLYSSTTRYKSCSRNTSKFKTRYIIYISSIMFALNSLPIHCNFLLCNRLWVRAPVCANKILYNWYMLISAKHYI